MSLCSSPGRPEGFNQCCPSAAAVRRAGWRAGWRAGSCPSRLLAVLPALLLLMVCAGGARAADVRLVVDVSASMTHSDPENIRGEALGSLLRLLPDEGRAGVWIYADDVKKIVDHARSDALWKEKAAIRTRELSPLGPHANLADAVAAATWDRHEADAGSVHVIVLSAGRLSVSDDAAANTAAEQRLLAELAVELASADYTVHTLALSATADVHVLEQLAALTGGYHGRPVPPGKLPAGLLDLLGWAALPAELPVGADGGFRVAPGTRSLTVWRPGARLDESVTLVDPNGRRLQRTTSRERVRWHVDAGYELITLRQPAPGTWRFEGPADALQVRAYGDLAVSYLDLPGTLFPGGLRSFEFALVSDGQEIHDPDFLDLVNVSARLVGSDGSTPLVVEPASSGRFRVNLLALREQGDYQLETRVWGPTFDQHLTLPLALRNPLTIEVRPRDDGFVVWSRVHAPELHHQSLHLAAMVKRPPAAARLLPMQRLPTGMWKLDVPGDRGMVEVTLDMRGRYLNDRPFELRTEPIRVVLPVAEVQQVNLDLGGQALLVAPPAHQDAAAHGAADAAGARPARPPGALSAGVAGTVSRQDTAPRLPVWLAVVVGALNLTMGLSLWWLLRAPRYSEERQQMLERLRELAVSREEAAAENQTAAA